MVNPASKIIKIPIKNFEIEIPITVTTVNKSFKIIIYNYMVRVLKKNVKCPTSNVVKILK